MRVESKSKPKPYGQGVYDQGKGKQEGESFSIGAGDSPNSRPQARVAGDLDYGVLRLMQSRRQGYITRTMKRTRK
eukprot:g47746.t1